MHSRGPWILTSIVFALLSASADAAPLVSVDVDPDTDGVQSARTVALGSLVEIEILISDVEVAEPLHAFELDLVFDPAIVLSLSVADGGFLASPSVVVESDIGPPDVNYALTRLGTAGVAGAGRLVSIELEANAIGTTPLELSMVLLSAPDGMPITGFSLANGSLTVVPEPAPGALLLLACALARWTGGISLGRA